MELDKLGDVVDLRVNHDPDVTLLVVLCDFVASVLLELLGLSLSRHDGLSLRVGVVGKEEWIEGGDQEDVSGKERIKGSQGSGRDGVGDPVFRCGVR